MPPVLTVVAALCSLLALAGAAYFGICIWAARQFIGERGKTARPPFAPPVSILRSLKGLDPEMYRAFRSHCLLDYDRYEVLFGASAPNDPAMAIATQLQEEFPGKNVRIMLCPKELGLNGKVSNLVQMLPAASYEHI